jgi:hypothetical protein
VYTTVKVSPGQKQALAFLIGRIPDVPHENHDEGLSILLWTKGGNRG